MKEEPQPIGEVIESWLKRKKFVGSVKRAFESREEDSEEARHQLVFACWEEAVGKRIAKAVIPYRFERGILYVCTESSSWAQEIPLIKPEIIRRINEKLGRDFVSDIHCRIGTPRRSMGQKQATKDFRMPTPTELAKVRLPKQIEQQLDETVSPIQDDELRGIVRRVFALHMKLKLWRERHGLRRCEKCGEIYKSEEKECPICSAKIEQF